MSAADKLFHLACMNGDVAEAKALLKKGASILYESIEGEPLICTMCRHNASYEVIKLLLDFGADPNSRVYFHPLADYKEKVVVHSVYSMFDAHGNFTLRRGEPARRPKPVPMEFALGLACMFCPVEVVQLLIERGANVNSVDDFGNTPLHHARNEATALALLQAGADKSIRNLEDYTPLDRIILCQTWRRKVHRHMQFAVAIATFGMQEAQ